MLNIKNYLEDVTHIIEANSPAQLKMFIFRHMEENPDLKVLLDLDRPALKIYLYHLKNEILPHIKEQLNDIDEKYMH